MLPLLPVQPGKLRPRGLAHSHTRRQVQWYSRSIQARTLQPRVGPAHPDANGHLSPPAPFCQLINNDIFETVAQMNF